MHGEIGIKVKEIRISGYNNEKGTFDISLSDENGVLHLCGDNNWYKLLDDAFYNIKKERQKTRYSLFNNSGHYSNEELAKLKEYIEEEQESRLKELPF